MKKLTIQNINCRIARQLATAGLILSLSSAWAQTPVKIGFLAELSGPTAGVGQDHALDQCGSDHPDDHVGVADLQRLAAV